MPLLAGNSHNCRFPIDTCTNLLTNPTARYQPVIQAIARSGNNPTESVYLLLLIMAYGIIINKVVRNS